VQEEIKKRDASGAGGEEKREGGERTCTCERHGEGGGKGMDGRRVRMSTRDQKNGQHHTTHTHTQIKRPVTEKGEEDGTQERAHCAVGGIGEVGSDCQLTVPPTHSFPHQQQKQRDMLITSVGQSVDHGTSTSTNCVGRPSLSLSCTRTERCADAPAVHGFTLTLCPDPPSNVPPPLPTKQRRKKRELPGKKTAPPPPPHTH